MAAVKKRQAMDPTEIDNVNKKANKNGCKMRRAQTAWARKKGPSTMQRPWRATCGERAQDKSTAREQGAKREGVEMSQRSERAKRPERGASRKSTQEQHER